MLTEETVRQSAVRAGVSEAPALSLLVNKGFKSQKALDAVLAAFSERKKAGVPGLVEDPDDPQKRIEGRLEVSDRAILSKLLRDLPPEGVGVEDVAVVDS